MTYTLYTRAALLVTRVAAASVAEHWQLRRRLLEDREGQPFFKPRPTIDKDLYTVICHHSIAAAAV